MQIRRRCRLIKTSFAKENADEPCPCGAVRDCPGRNSASSVRFACPCDRVLANISRHSSGDSYIINTTTMYTNRPSTIEKFPRGIKVAQTPTSSASTTSGQCLLGVYGSSCLSELGATSSMLPNWPAVEYWNLPITSIVTYTPHPGSQSAEDFVFTGTSTLTWLTGPLSTSPTSAATYSAPSIAKVLPAVFLVFLLE